MITIEHKRQVLFNYIARSLTLVFIFSMFFELKISYASIINDNEIVSVTFINGGQDQNMHIHGAIQFKLNPGWKTFWKNPGPYGVTPIIDWSKSDNIKKIEIFWPTPEIYDQSNEKVIGYANSLTLPIKIFKKLPSRNAILNIDLKFGMCSDICLIKTAKIYQAVNNIAPEENIELISRALEKIPSKFTDQVFSVSKCYIETNNKKLNITYLIEFLKNPNSDPSVIIYYAFSHHHPENQTVTINGTELLASASLNKINAAEGSIERNRLKAIVIFDNKGFDLDGCS